MSPETIALITRAIEQHPNVGPFLHEPVVAGVIPHFGHPQRHSLIVSEKLAALPTPGKAAEIVAETISVIRGSGLVSELYGMEIVMQALHDGRATRLLRYGQKLNAPLAIDSRLVEHATEESLLSVYPSLKQ